MGTEPPTQFLATRHLFCSSISKPSLLLRIASAGSLSREAETFRGPIKWLIIGVANLPNQLNIQSANVSISIYFVQKTMTIQ